jgi:hypothetical protein
MPADTKFACSKTQAFAEKNQLSGDVIAWFIAGGCVDYSDVSVGADNAAEAKTVYAEPLIAKGFLKAELPGDAIKIKKFWIQCNDQYQLDRNPSAGTGEEEEAVIPLKEELSIQASWTFKHNFQLPDAQLLVRTSLGKLWRDYGASPPHISVWLAEQIRTRSNIHPHNGLRMSVVAGKTPVAENVIVDPVDVAFELFKRIRAFFFSLAYVSVLTPDWFPLQSAIIASEQIFEYVTATYNGRTPPIGFLVEAWAHTSHYFSEALRMGQKKRTAAEIIGNLGAWENKWKWTPQAAVADEYVSPDSQPDNRALQSKLNEMEGKLKRFQAQADRDTTAKNQQRDSGKGDGPARKKAKGGHPWGQAQGQGSGKQWQGSGKKGGGKKHRR